MGSRVGEWPLYGHALTHMLFLPKQIDMKWRGVLHTKTFWQVLKKLLFGEKGIFLRHVCGQPLPPLAHVFCYHHCYPDSPCSLGQSPLPRVGIPNVFFISDKTLFFPSVECFICCSRIDLHTKSLPPTKKFFSPMGLGSIFRERDGYW